ncbi:MAG: glucosamine-6-phosphate deaminase [Victivallaceae bacterium]|nr:glucosamine-6-phosphate deaminase [Victivallaceae bacterium]
MKWIGIKNYGAMSRYGAERLFSVISAKLAAGQAVNVGMATGNTMIKLYAVLAGMLNYSGLELAKLFTFNLDEYIGMDGKNLDCGHPLSYRKYMTENFFDLIDPASGFKQENMFFPDAAAPADYDVLIVRRGGLDIQLLGIGFNGHIGFNEPVSETKISREDVAALPSHVVELDGLTLQTNAVLTAGSNLSLVPRRAVTMGMADILKAKEIILLACFAEQTAPLQAVRSGKITPELPASFLLEHKAAEIVYTEDKIKLD